MRKGISPLISTLLLMLFAIALGIVVMSWGHSTYTPFRCEDTKLKVLTLNDLPQICIRNKILYFTLQNIGISPVVGVKVVTINSDILSQELKTRLEGGDVVRLSTKTNSEYIKKVILTPMIRAGPCPNQGIEIENINLCEEK